MTKNTLLLATAAVALLTGATNSMAAEITGTGPLFTGVSSSGDSTAYPLANEVRFSANYTTSATFADTRGTLPFTFTTSNADGFPNGESLLLTLDLSGAVFDAPTDPVLLATGSADCSVSISPATPVTAGATSATYFVSFSGCTASGTGLAVELPVQVTGANDVVVGARLQSSFGGQLFDVDGGRASATFIESVDGFSATITPTNNAAVATVGSNYTSFGSETIANAVITVNTAANVDLEGTNATADDIASVRILANATSGSFTGFNLVNGDDSFGTTSASATQSTVRVLEVNPTSATTTITIAAVDNTATASGTPAVDLNGSISATSVTLTAQVDLLADDDFATSTGQFVDFSTATGAIQAVTRDGASFIAPWIAFGGASATSTIRLGNNGGSDTGPITMTLLSDNAAGDPTNATVTVTQGMLQSGTLTASGGIPAGGIVSINGAALRNAFGTTAANGDVQVAIEAQTTFISGKVRVTQASGQIFETSLGNLNTGPF